MFRGKRNRRNQRAQDWRSERNPQQKGRRRNTSSRFDTRETSRNTRLGSDSQHSHIRKFTRGASSHTQRRGVVRNRGLEYDTQLSHVGRYSASSATQGVNQTTAPEGEPRHKRRRYDTDDSNRHPKEGLDVLPRERGVYEQKRFIGLHKLNELETKTPTEVLFYLKTANCGFKELLNEEKLSKETIRCIWSVIAIACRSEQKETLSEFLKDVNHANKFVVTELQHLLLGVQTGLCETEDIHTLENITTFLEAIQVLPPSTTLSTTALVLPILKDTVKVHITLIQQDLLLRLERLEEIRTKARERFTIQFDIIQDLPAPAGPPDCFRNIPIIPNRDDVINADPFLRPNVVEGRYKDVEHYLDVQFRLLREDFVRPLREGIVAYQLQLSQGQRGRINDIKIYHDVMIIQGIVSGDGVFHEIYLPLIAQGHRIKRETSKRLIYGSLLCFSTDNFDTMIFATVALRDAEKLKKGNICVRFEEKNILEIEKDFGQKYTMIETEAYFEAYRHNLTALKELSVDNFPLQEYIVNVEKVIKLPQYAKMTDIMYCLGPIYDKMPEPKPLSVQLGETLKTNTQDAKKTKVCLENDCACSSVAKIPIHDSEKWPQDIYDLDKSQLDALKASLTQRLSIIQGPPGTGKTHLGLKIVQLLLHNRKVWSQNSDQCPILVVCYTNHALDQFLTGILKSTRKVVRIGGRSKNPAMDSYNLKELLRNANPYILQDYTTRYRKEIQHGIENIRRRIFQLEGVRRNCEVEVLPIFELSDSITGSLFDSLGTCCPYDLLHELDSESVLLWWLGVDTSPKPNLSPITFQSDEPDYLILDEKSESEDEIDFSQPYEDIKYYTEKVQVHIMSLSSKRVPNLRETVTARKNDRKFNGENVNETPKTSRREKEASDLREVENTKKSERRESLVKRNLNCKAMPEKESQCYENAWSLKPCDRWRLYRAWLDTYIRKCENDILEFKEQYGRQIVLLGEINHERERLVVRGADVIGLTTTGAAKYKHLIKGMRSKIVIVEEAAEVLEAHIVTALNKDTEHLILIGDHKQLRPNPAVYELAKKYHLEISLFERLIKNGLPYSRLNVQHRMKPCISKLLVPSIYTDLEDNHTVRNYGDIKGMEMSMYFVSHSVNESKSYDSTSHVNSHEIEYLVELCRYLMLQGYDPSRITILTTYLAQFFLIKQAMIGTLNEVRVSVLDNFQGEESDIILLSLVRSNDNDSIGFLKSDNRVCVALSRAKLGLYCIGNFDLLAKQSKLWETVCKELIKQKAIGEALSIKCQSHGNLVPMKTAADFLKVSDGGCLEKCDIRLLCGHVCPRNCHSDDLNHEKLQCRKPCERIICERNHKCPKLCGEDCAACIVKVEKSIPTCQHTATMACHVDPSKFVCQLPCIKPRPCGHPCPGLCGTSCYKCKVFVTRRSPCGHEVKIYCCYSEDSNELKSVCKRSCEKILACGHGCSKRCNEKCTDLCQVEVTFDLLCGHELKASCFAVLESRNSQWDYERPSFWSTSPSYSSQDDASPTSPMYSSQDDASPDYRITSPKIMETCCKTGHSVLYKQHKKILNKLVATHLEADCTAPCRKELECGHICKGTCGQCFQGRLHITCSEVCGKKLVCGHLCTYPCANSCPPCTLNCKNRCVHSRCNSPCGVPCKPCMEECIWKCNHHRCLRLCSEPCDRPPCNRPCRKWLKCRHKCIGMCGEPCPTKCRVCDEDEVTNIFFGEEDHPRACFLQLEDCGHVFEVRGLTQWLGEQGKETAEIQMPTCPVCKVPIRKNMRFNALVKQTIITIENIKEKVFGEMDENKRLFENLENKTSKFRPEKHNYAASGDPYFIYETIKWVLRNNNIYNLDQERLSLLGYYYTFAEKMSILGKNLYSLKDVISTNVVQISKNNPSDFFGLTMKEISQKILHNTQRGSVQLLNDVSWEIRRLEVISDFFKSFQEIFKSADLKCKEKLSEAFKIMLSYSTFRDAEDLKLAELKKEIISLSKGITILGVTEEERVSIVKAMGMKQGHWYTCPNGHVYCITECGGAMEESRCSECLATIGGTKHRLRPDNRVATVMDGARHSAWSENANMGNFDLNNLV